ncbi:hypothetical protein NDN08_005220 [Rhodosorus marinus]|uniref:Peptidase S26 domain-containing protein n=1 Tax=Rhodosorus marinus TaxID=101924 RepID=A0AAV8V477_9RHOD|nr:hypothetical protein NDN08_005220 [Rhodosorus marinus]
MRGSIRSRLGIRALKTVVERKASASNDVKSIQNTGGSTWESVKETIVLCIKVSSFAYCLNTYFASTKMCVGPSMLPTLEESGSLVIEEHISSYYGNFKNGDIVIAKPPYDSQVTVCKRICAMGGEKAACIAQNSSKTEEFVVPDGHVWLEGDNPKNSRDSRSYGPVPLGLLHGKVIFKLWPLKNFGSLPARSASETTGEDASL